MLRNFAAALLATALIAGPALAAQPSGNAGSTPAAAAATHTVTNQAKPAKTVKHVRKHSRKHIARAKMHTMKQVHHVKPAKTHTSGFSKHHKISKSAA